MDAEVEALRNRLAAEADSLSIPDNYVIAVFAPAEMVGGGDEAWPEWVKLWDLRSEDGEVSWRSEEMGATAMGQLVFLGEDIDDPETCNALRWPQQYAGWEAGESQEEDPAEPGVLRSVWLLRFR